MGWRLILLTFTMVFASCYNTTITQTQIIGKKITFKGTKIPHQKEETIKSSFDKTVRAIYSDSFEILLTIYMKDSLKSGEHIASWDGWNATNIVAKMRGQLEADTVKITTYGGINGFYLYHRYGNLAFDGASDGPIRINRIPLKWRSSESLANTFAHETAHKIGLKHPHSDIKGKFKVAEKEPPYVIGDIIERIASHY